MAHISGGQATVAIWIFQCRHCVNCDGGEKFCVGLRKPVKTKSLVFERKQLPTAGESYVNSVPVSKLSNKDMQRSIFVSHVS